MRSIDSQVAAMRKQWPEFRLVQKTSKKAAWEGKLTPMEQAYRIKVSLFLGRPHGRRAANRHPPRVIVLDPILFVPTGIEGGLPHVYKNDEAPDYPYLCLYDPEQNEWMFDYHVANTTIVWCWEWLLFYEQWQVTGKWGGGGRHPSGPVSE